MATVANNAGPTAPPSGAYPSDETILGIFDESGVGGNDRADDFDALLAGAMVRMNCRRSMRLRFRIVQA